MPSAIDRVKSKITIADVLAHNGEKAPQYGLKQSEGPRGKKSERTRNCRSNEQFNGKIKSVQL